MTTSFTAMLRTQLEDLKLKGLYKNERILYSPQAAHIITEGKRAVLNLCANNYLGLANHPRLIEAAKKSYAQYGFGLASVRFICGTQDLHKKLEKRLSAFLGTEDTILYSSCFDANGGLFETLLGAEDCIISDALNHASIIDGIRLCKAKRLRYQNNDMQDLKIQLQAAQDARFRLIATDGVFSMDGVIANLRGICDLAQRYHAMVMVDDCHATGFLGKEGRGSIEHCQVLGEVDIITGTLGKALGGASGGYISGKAAVIEWLRQRSRPYLFSNSLAPALVAGALEALDMVQQGEALRHQLKDNSQYFRAKMSELGYQLVPGEHPIIPIMLGEAELAKRLAEEMLQQDVFVVAFSYPVVPEGKARIRTQMSASHTKADLDKAISAFEMAGRKLKLIN